jgi:hypothetical protein
MGVDPFGLAGSGATGNRRYRNSGYEHLAVVKESALRRKQIPARLISAVEVNPRF